VNEEAAPPRLRILVVAQDFPWPVVTGSLIRLSNVITALSRLGDVDLFSFVHSYREDPWDLPADAPVARAATAVYTERPFTVGRRLGWLAARSPIHFAVTDYQSPQDCFADWAKPPYDLVWFSKAHTYESLDRPELGPTIVDLDDLEDQKVRARLEVWRAEPPQRNAVHARMARLQALLDARRWRGLQKSISRSAEAVAVCSRLDAARLDVPNAVVVTNGYDDAVAPAGRLEVSAPPTLLLAGVLFYPPNADGARWLGRQVLPHLRRLVPDVRLRLVGATWPPVQELHDPPAVTVVGRVPDMLPELREADAIVVPIRFGSGTRVKILEAFAHRIPVVSTTLGAEGLEVEHERHLLLADTPEDFASACSRVLTDPALRERLADAGEHLFRSSYTWSHTVDAVDALARQHIRTAVGAS
jgi:glycosyltransferase involved in cell wall biosynthesis